MSKQHQPAFEKACQDMQRIDPVETAWRSGTRYQELDGGSQFEVRFWGKDYIVRYPEIAIWEAESGQEPPLHYQIITLHYLLTADGTPPADRWVAFRELPDARFYDGAFQNRANLPLARAFSHDLERFIRACQALGGERLTFGDASFLFRIFPNLFMAVVLHLGDEEFPASANVLYDAAAGHYLPTEDLAVLGGLLSSRLIRSQSQL